MIALVGQEPVLFARSVAENISYGLSGAITQVNVVESVKMVNAYSFITPKVNMILFAASEEAHSRVRSKKNDQMAFLEHPISFIVIS
jgi:ABC-type transport system involved in cytochrome bd biosynthesis fused ATPase/permease subunit